MRYFLIIILVFCFCGCLLANQEEDLITTLADLELYTREVKQEMIQVLNNVEENLRSLRRLEFDWLRHYFRLKKRIPKKEHVLNKADRNAEDLIAELERERRDIKLHVEKYKAVNGDPGNPETIHGNSLLVL